MNYKAGRKTKILSSRFLFRSKFVKQVIKTCLQLRINAYY